MRLQELFAGLKVKWPDGPGKNMDLDIQSLEYDSRRVRSGSLFFAVSGLATDGHLYIDQALEKGARAIVSEREAPPDFSVPWIRVDSIRALLALAAGRFYNHPSQHLKLVGITGTDGKTTTAFLVHSILEQDSPALLMGTIKTRVGKWEIDSVRTTPEAVDIQQTLARALEGGCRHGVMEVSSHALFLQRVYHCHFPVGVFTNLSQDHLDFHRDLDDYFGAKSLLFRAEYNPSLKYAVLNADDPFASRIEVPAGARRITFGFSESADAHPTHFETSLEGTRVELRFMGRTLSLHSPMPGRHNIYNILSAVASTAVLGLGDDQIRQGIACLSAVPGRFEKVQTGRPFTVIVDYAHTPRALENVLDLSRRLARGRIICVFGCGGDRDRGKRPAMGAIAARGADWAIVTSDNPRREDPEKIIDDIRRGIPEDARNYEVIADRRRAIARALEKAREEDIILIAGKGHETYQEIGQERIHFDDREVVQELT